MPNSNGIAVVVSTNYIPEEDVTIVWQYINIEDCEFSQRTLVGWYYGEPDDRATEHYAQMPLTAQFY